MSSTSKIGGVWIIESCAFVHVYVAFYCLTYELIKCDVHVQTSISYPLNMSGGTKHEMLIKHNTLKIALYNLRCLWLTMY